MTLVTSQTGDTSHDMSRCHANCVRNHLPVTKLNFGSLDGEGQEAGFELGHLYCSGSRDIISGQRLGGPGSCDQLWRQGGAVTGYHMVRGEDDLTPRVVYCDMDKLPGHPGFQRQFSSPGDMRQNLAFDVFLREPVTDNFR